MHACNLVRAPARLKGDDCHACALPAKLNAQLSIALKNLTLAECSAIRRV